MKLEVGFSTGKGFAPLSWVIRQEMGTPYSHTYLHFPGSHLVFEANQKGVQMIPCEKWEKSNKVIKVVSIEITHERYQEIMAFVEANEGKPYSNWQLVVILFNLPFDNGGKSYICSELIARVLAPELGLTQSKLDKMKPIDIYNLVMEKYND